MPKPTPPTDAERAALILHEDQVSASVEAALKRLDRNRWALYHARDYLLGVLQLLESARLLRDLEAERVAEENRIAQLRVFGEHRTDRENAYRALAMQVAAWSGIPGAHERLDMIDDARSEHEYRDLVRRFESDELPRLIEQWREERRLSAEAVVARVRALLDPKRKTVPMLALLDALNPPADSAATTENGA